MESGTSGGNGSKPVASPSTLFLSDLHLSPDRPLAVAAFHAFAAGPARAAAAVYILGDLFDWWVGDDQMREPFVAPIVASLRSISDAGVPLFVAHGNRDFRRRFRTRDGATCCPSNCRSIFTACPHSFATAMNCAPTMRNTRRASPASGRALTKAPVAPLLRPHGWPRGCAARAATTNRLPEYIMDVNADAVAQALRVHRAQRIIHGHTHRPARHEHFVDGTPRERWVMADWHDRGRHPAGTPGVHERDTKDDRALLPGWFLALGDCPHRLAGGR
jgi:UDP-2,3-diacylglucosamine hydrolase